MSEEYSVSELKLKYEAYKFRRMFTDIEDVIHSKDLSFSEFCKQLKSEE